MQYLTLQQTSLSLLCERPRPRALDSVLTNCRVKVWDDRSEGDNGQLDSLTYFRPLKRLPSILCRHRQKAERADERSGGPPDHLQVAAKGPFSRLAKASGATRSRRQIQFEPPYMKPAVSI